MSHFFFYNHFKNRQQLNLISQEYEINQGKVIIEGIDIEGILVYFKKLTKEEVIHKICEIREDNSKRYQLSTTIFYHDNSIKEPQECNIII